MSELDNGFNKGSVIPPYQPEPLNTEGALTSKIINDNAFYTAGNMGFPDADAMAGIFDKIKEEYQTTGYSSLVTQALSIIKTEQDNQAKESIQGLIEDSSVSNEDKIGALQSYVYGFKPNNELRNKYINTMSSYQMMETPEDDIRKTEMSIDKVKLAQEAVILGESLHQQLVNLKKNTVQPIENSEPAKLIKAMSNLYPGYTKFLEMSDDELEDKDGFFYGLGVNATQILNAFVVELLPYITELGSTAAVGGTKDPDNVFKGIVNNLLIEDNDALKATKNWKELRDYIRNLYGSEPEKVLGLFNDYKGVGPVGDVALNVRDFLKFAFRFGGLIANEDEYDSFVAQESTTGSVFKTIDEGLLWAGGKITPNDPEKAKVFLEIGSFFAIWGAKKGKNIAVKTKKRYDLSTKYNSTVADFVAALDEAQPLNAKGEPLKGIAPESSNLSWEEVFNKEKQRQGVPLEGLKVLEEVEQINVNSPIISTTVANKMLANALVEDAIIDGSGKLAEHIGTTRTKITSLAFAPSLALLTKPAHIDMHEWSLMQELSKTLGTEYFENTGFLFHEQRKTWIRDVDNILDDISAGIDIYQRNSDSLFITTEGGLQTSIVFSKLPDSNYKSISELTSAVEVVTQKISETGKKDFKVSIEQVDNIGAVTKRWESLNEFNADPIFQKAIDTPENIKQQIEQLVYNQKESKKILLNRVTLKNEAEIAGVDSATYKNSLSTKIDLRDVEIRNLSKELQIAQQLEGKLSETPNLRIRVDRRSEWFDSGQAISDGFNNPPVRSNWLTRMVFESDKMWKGLAHFGTINKALEENMHAAGLRSNAWLKNELQTIQKEVNKLNQSQRADVQSLYLKQQGFVDYPSITQIYDMLGRPNLKLQDAEMYQKVLYRTRSLEKFRFEAENLFEISRLRSEGYKQSFKASILDREGKPQVRNIVAKEEFFWSQADSPPEVFDFTNGKPVANLWAEINSKPETRRLFDTNGKTNQKIYRLSKVHYDEAGNGYQYGVFGKQEASVLPQRVIDTKTGHMPMIMVGSKFIRAYPKRFKLDGKELDYTKQFNDGTIVESSFIQAMTPYKRAIMVAPTELAAKRWQDSSLEAWAREQGINTQDYFFRIEDANELSALDRVEAQTIRENAMKASVQRSELPVAKAVYEDLFASFVMVTESNGSRAFINPILNEYKVRWLGAHNNKNVAIDYNRANQNPLEGGKPITSEFPLQREQIRPLPGKEREHAIALKEFDQIMVLDQGHPANWIGTSIAKLSGNLAKYADEYQGIPLLEKAMQGVAEAGYKIQRRPSIIQNSPMRATSILKIQWQVPMWHWMIQTSNSFGHLAVAGYTGFNKQTLANYYTTAGQAAAIVSDIVLQKIDTKKHLPAIREGLDWMQKQDIANTSASILEVSAKDRQLIIQNGLKSGFFHIADHTFSKNFWKQGPKKLSDGRVSRFFGSLNETIGTVGFEQGELMGRVNTWMATRLDWVQKNPGKNWRSPLALEEITSGARKLAGSMDQFGEMGIQRIPVLATFAQFSSFLMKSGESMWNTSATPFTPKQMVAHSAWNFAVYGVRGGMWYGSFGLIYDMYKSLFGEEQADELMTQIDDYALLNIMMNGMTDLVMPTHDDNGNLIKSDLEFNMRFSPMGADLPFGGYGAFYKYIMKEEGLGSESFGPSGQLLKDIFGKNGITDMFQAIWSKPIDDITQTQDQLLGSAQVLAKLTGLTSATSRYIILQSINDKRSKSGQLSGLSITRGEKDIWGWTSVTSKEERQAYEIFAVRKDRKAALDGLADDLYKGVVLTLGNNATTYDIAQLHRGLKVALDGSAYLDEQDSDYLYDKLMTTHDRTKETMYDNLYRRALEQNVIERNTHPNKIMELKKLKDMSKLHQDKANYQSLEQIITILENNASDYPQEKILKERKDLHERGSLY